MWCICSLETQSLHSASLLLNTVTHLLHCHMWLYMGVLVEFSDCTSTNCRAVEFPTNTHTIYQANLHMTVFGVNFHPSTKAIHSFVQQPGVPRHSNLPGAECPLFLLVSMQLKGTGLPVVSCPPLHFTQGTVLCIWFTALQTAGVLCLEEGEAQTDVTGYL